MSDNIVWRVAKELSYQFECGGAPPEDYLEAAQAVVDLVNAPEPPKCSYGPCLEPAIWDRKPGWMAAPGSAPGPVCEEHHCWKRI